MGDRAASHEKIEMLRNMTLNEVLGTDDDGVQAVSLQDTQTGSNRELALDGVFLGIGHIPNTMAFKGFVDLDAEGYVNMKPGTAHTSRPGVFAAGDLHDKEYRQAVTASGFGCMAALDVERYLSNT